MYTRLPYSGMEYLPSTAVEVLKEEGKWSDELEALTMDYIIDVGNKLSEIETLTDNEVNEDSVIDTEHDEIIEVKGKTTFADVIDWGVEKEMIEDIIGFEIKNENMLIRDECEANGLNFSEIKSLINELLE